MKIYIIMDCATYNVNCGQIIDTSLQDSPITDIQAVAPCRTNYATASVPFNPLEWDLILQGS